MIVKYPLLIIVILSIVLRLPYLDGSFWMDEAAQALEVVRPFSQQLEISADFQPPLLHLVLHLAQYFSHSEWFLRTIGALIPGIITIVYTYKIAKHLFSQKVATITGLLLATSSFHIFFSQELRPYSLPAMLATLSMYFFLQAIEKKTKDDFIYLTLSNTLGLYASYLYPFFMLSQIAYIVCNKRLRKTKAFLNSFVISILSFVPLLPIFLGQLEQGGIVRTTLPGWDQVVSTPQLKAIPLVFGKLIFGVLPLDANFLIITLSVLLFISGIAILHTLLKNSQKTQIQIVMYWIIVPVLTAWLISFIVPVVSPKRLLYILPGIYILCSYAFVELYTSNFKKNIARFTLATVFIVNAIATTSYYVTAQLQRENWRTLHQQIHREFKPTETLLVYSFINEFAPMAWYEQYETESFPKYATGVLHIDGVADLPNQLKVAANYKTVLVFDYLRDLTDPERKIDTHLKELGFKQVGVLDYPNIGFVRIFMQPQAVIGYR